MNTWTFRKWKDSAYQLRYFEAGERSADSLPHSVLGDTALFDVHLVELRGNLFMDLYPNQPAVRTDLCLIHMLPVHTFWKVTMKDREVEIAMLNQEWLDKMVEEGKVKIQHERVNDEVILTAPTGDLQKLVSAFADDPRAFPEPAVLRKVAD